MGVHPQITLPQFSINFTHILTHFISIAIWKSPKFQFLLRPLPQFLIQFMNCPLEKVFLAQYNSSRIAISPRRLLSEINGHAKSEQVHQNSEEAKKIMITLCLLAPKSFPANITSNARRISCFSKEKWDGMKKRGWEAR